MPERPTNPRILHADGSVTPVELAYQGIDDRDIHVWTCMTMFDPAAGDRLAVDKLPARTGITMPAALPPEYAEGDDDG